MCPEHCPIGFAANPCPLLPIVARYDITNPNGINGLAESVRLIRGTSVNQPTKNLDHVLVTSGASMPTSAIIIGKLN